VTVIGFDGSANFQSKPCEITRMNQSTQICTALSVIKIRQEAVSKYADFRQQQSMNKVVISYQLKLGGNHDHHTEAFFSGNKFGGNHRPPAHPHRHAGTGKDFR